MKFGSNPSRFWRNRSRSKDCDVCKDCSGGESSESDYSSDYSGGSRSTGRSRSSGSSYSTNESSYSSESERDWSEAEYKEGEGKDDSKEKPDSEKKQDDSKSDGAENKTVTPAASQKRKKRDTNGHGHKRDGHKRHRRDHGHHGHKKRRGWKMTQVTMPTGKKFFITKPDMHPDWKCGNKTRMYTFKPDGYHGKREHNIVMKEMEKTMIDLAGAVFRGGVYKKYNIIKLQKLVNPCLWRRYRFSQGVIREDAGFVNGRMLFHGSTRAAEIASTGFDECYANPNGVYGAGLYFTQNSSAANEYAFGIVGGKGCPKHSNKNCYECERQILLCRVTLGKEYKKVASFHYAHAPVGHHSVVGKGPTSYYEYVIYRSEQAYPEYLITYKIVP